MASQRKLERKCVAVLSVTTFWSFLREFSPLEVYDSGIRRFLMIRPRVSVGEIAEVNAQR